MALPTTTFVKLHFMTPTVNKNSGRSGLLHNNHHANTNNATEHQQPRLRTRNPRTAGQEFFGVDDLCLFRIEEVEKSLTEQAGKGKELLTTHNRRIDQVRERN